MTEEALGKVVTAAEFLGLTKEDEAIIAIRLALHKALRESRERSGLTQVELAKRLGSSQSRVAKAESGSDSVSIDLLVKGMLATGATPAQIGETIGNAVARELVEVDG